MSTRRFIVKKSMVASCLVILLVSMLLSSLGVQEVQAAGITYYVATNGSDLNSGTIVSPYKTIAKATSMMSAGDTVIIRGGTYRETLMPTASGTSGSPIIYKAYTGETVTVNGTDLITGWTIDSGNIYKAPMNWDLGSQNQVFVNGSMMHLAQFPNWPNPETTVFNPGRATISWGTATSIHHWGLDGKPTDYWKGATVWVLGSWSAQSTTVTASSNDGITINTLPWSDGYTIPSGGREFIVMGVKGELDTANEWFYNSSTSQLHLWAPGGISPSTLTVEAKKRQYAIDLNGKSYIQLNGINTFGGSITTGSGSNNVIQGTNALYVDHDIQLQTAYSQDTLGVSISGNNNTFRDGSIRYSSGNGLCITGADNKVVNNKIYDVDYASTYDGGISIKGDRHLVSYNTIYNTARASIGLEDVDAVIIEYNELYNTARFSNDVGAIYIAKEDGGNTIIRYNKVHDTFSHGAGPGIYFDSGVSNFIIDHNTQWNSDKGIQINQPGNYMLVDSNMFTDFTDAYFSNGSFDDDFFGTRFTNNIVTNASNNNIDGDSVQFSNSQTGYNQNAYPAAGQNLTNPPSAVYNPMWANYPLRNLINNAGFDRDLNAWTKTDATNAFKFTATYDPLGMYDRETRTGFGSARLGGGVDGIEQVVTGLTPNTKYIVSAWGRVPSGETAVLGVKSFGGTDTTIDFGTTSPNWAEKRITFTTGPSSTNATLYLKKTSSGTGYVYVDDAGLINAANREIQIVSGTTYKFNVKHSGMAMDVDGNSMSDGAGIIQWSQSNAINQQWTVTSTSGGYYKIISTSSGKALAVSGGSTADGAGIVQQTYTADTNYSDEWSIVNSGVGYCNIINRKSGKSLDMPGSSWTAGTQFIQWTSGTGDNQKFQVSLAGGSHMDYQALEALITSAQSKHDSAVEGNGNGQYPVGSKQTLLEAINQAKQVRDSVSVTQQQLQLAANDLTAALQAFEVVVNVNVQSVTVTGASAAINVKGGTLQLGATVLPANAANKSLTWAVYEADGVTTDKATIDQTGLLTAAKDGTVMVVATATDGTTISGVKEITLSGQTIIDPGTDPVNVATINITNSGNVSAITAKNGNLQLQAAVLPANATNKSVTWAVYEADGFSVSDKATIDTNGMLTAAKNGTVKVSATAIDGSGTKGSSTITISGQSPVTSISVYGEGAAQAITIKDGTLQMHATILPTGANSNVTWSIWETDGVTATNKGTINANGVLTAKKDGVVKVVATATDGSGIRGTNYMILSGQTALPTSVPQATLMGPASIQAGASFSTNFGLSNVSASESSAVYAADMTLSYNANAINFVSVEPLKSGFRVVQTTTDVPGQIRILAFSEGEAGAITTSGDVFKFNWTAKPNQQSATVNFELTNVDVSNALSQKMDALLANLTVSVTGVDVTAVDKTTLQTVMTLAQTIYDRAVEGTQVLQYPAGTKAVLVAAINAANAIKVNPASTQQQLDAAANVLNLALQHFNEQMITVYAPGDVNGDRSIDIGDLGKVAVHYGKNTTSADWNQIKDADFNHDGKIDIIDLTGIASLILQ